MTPPCYSASRKCPGFGIYTEECWSYLLEHLPSLVWIGFGRLHDVADAENWTVWVLDGIVEAVGEVVVCHVG